MSPIISGGSSASSSGGATLLYDYTVSGSVKASIDTGVDGSFAGAFPSTYKLLEVFLYARADVANLATTMTGIINNNTGSIYSMTLARVINATPTDTASTGAANWSAFLIAGGSCTANVFSAHHIVFPNYADTSRFKTGTGTGGHGDAGNANGNVTMQFGLEAQDTAALTRLKFTVTNFAVGSRLTIFAR